MTKTVIDIQLHVPGKETRAMINGVDYMHSSRLILDIVACKPARFIAFYHDGTAPTLREKIAMWLFGSGK